MTYTSATDITLEVIADPTEPDVVEAASPVVRITLSNDTAGISLVASVEVEEWAEMAVNLMDQAGMWPIRSKHGLPISYDDLVKKGG